MVYRIAMSLYPEEHTAEMSVANNFTVENGVAQLREINYWRDKRGHEVDFVYVQRGQQTNMKREIYWPFVTSILWGATGLWRPMSIAP